MGGRGLNVLPSARFPQLRVLLRRQLQPHNLTNGSSNIYIDAPGVSAENNTIRIGAQGTGSGQQSSAYMAGIVSNPTSFVSPVPVVTIGTNGRLGVQNIPLGGGGGLTGSCNGGNGNFAIWKGTLGPLGCVTNLSDNGTTLTVAGDITATATVDASFGFSAGGAPGITATANLTDANGIPCTINFKGGIAIASSC